MAAASVIGLGFVFSPAKHVEASNWCSYIVVDSPTPVHNYPKAGTPDLKFKYAGDIVTGPTGPKGNCWIVNGFAAVYCSCANGGAGWDGYGWIYTSHLFFCGVDATCL